MELLKTSPHAIKLNPSCLGQAHYNRPGSGHAYENKEPGCILAVICVPSIIRLLRGADAKSGKVV